jgi:uncharacterized Zn finger protein
MIINIGDITAHCEACGGKEFEVLAAGALRLTSELRCKRCGTKCKYLGLLDQIGEEAMRRANDAIEELKRKKK